MRTTWQHVVLSFFMRAFAVDNVVVVPSFIPADTGLWLDPHSGKTYAYAEIIDVDCDFTTLHHTLCQHYPGLPAKLLEDWLVDTVITANGREVLPDVLYRVHYDYDNHYCSVSPKNDITKKIEVYRRDLRRY